MTQGAPTEEKVIIQDANPDTGKYLRLEGFLVAQNDGTFQLVKVEPGILLSPATSKPIEPMTAGQANEMIRLLRRMCEKLDELHEDLT